MPTATPSSQPQVITVVIYFPDAMLNGSGINRATSVCDWSCTVEVMIAFFIVPLNIPKLLCLSLSGAASPSCQSTDVRCTDVKLTCERSD